MLDTRQPRRRRLDSWEHQLDGYHFARDKPGSMLAFGMGTGKTKIVVDLITNDDRVDDVLVVAPKSVVPTWKNEFEKFGPLEIAVEELTGTVKKKAEQVETLRKRRLAGEIGRTVIVVNYDTVWRQPLLQHLLAKSWSFVVADESHRIKAPGGKASRAMHRIGKKASQRVALTGTPMPHSPMDVYAQYRFLDERVFGTSFVNFRSRYAITHPEFRSKILQLINREEFSTKFGTIGMRVRSEDVLDLPPKLHQWVTVSLSAKAKRLYRDLARDLVAQYDDEEITAANALVKLLRLQQITAGATKTEDGATIVVDNSKADALCDLVDSIGAHEKIVVFGMFHTDLDFARSAAVKCGMAYGELSGRANDLDGNKLPESIDGKDGYVFGVQLKSGGVGVDFTRSAYCVYFTQGFSLGDYDQSLARLHRPGQSRSVRYYHLIAEGTVDVAVAKALENRKQTVEEVFAYLREEL